MRSKSMFVLGLSVVAGVGAMSLMPSSARAAVLISDSFNRPDSSSLGQTDQGANWITRQFGTSTNPEIKDGALYYSTGQKSMPYVQTAPKIQDFVLEYDITQTDNTTTQTGYGLSVNFRGNSQSGQPADGGTQDGYTLLIAPASSTSKMSGHLLSDYGTIPTPAPHQGYWYLQDGTEVTAAATSTVHVKIQAEGNHIQAWINGTQTIDYTDLTSNPAAANNYAGGYFSFNANGGKAFKFDNLVISTVPEPGSAALLAIGALGLLARRRRRAC